MRTLVERLKSVEWALAKLMDGVQPAEVVAMTGCSAEEAEQIYRTANEAHPSGVRVYRFDDPGMPEHIAKVAYKGGDEDWVIVGPAADETTFFFVAEKLAGNNFRHQEMDRYYHEGRLYLQYTVCHS